MKLAFVQTAPILGSTRRNLEEAYALIERVRDARPSGSFPSCFIRAMRFEAVPRLSRLPSSPTN